jgi:histidinol-phosphate aminotransferase
MGSRHAVSRRGFVGGLATGIGFLGVAPAGLASAEPPPLRARRLPPPARPLQDYDSYAKLASNENPWGPSDAVMTAMTSHFKYANRYAYPDGDILEKIAAHHGVAPDNILLGAGSGEILEVVGLTFLGAGKKVVGVDPSYSQVYRHATNIRADAVLVPLREDASQDIPAVIQATRRNYRDVGFVYLVNPNNPTGVVVPKHEVAQLLDAVPADVPVLIDEAYHHYIQDPAYATAVPYVQEGRSVIIARTFSKISGLAGMRLGYAIAPSPLIDRMRAYSTGSINAIVKWGGVAALEDTASQVKVRDMTVALRTAATAELQDLGYPSIPSETNFFMVHIRRPVQPVIDAFRDRGVLVGRPFPPMLEHLRVSVGTEDEMSRFMAAFKQIFTTKSASGG